MARRPALLVLAAAALACEPRVPGRPADGGDEPDTGRIAGPDARVSVPEAGVSPAADAEPEPDGEAPDQGSSDGGEPMSACGAQSEETGGESYTDPRGQATVRVSGDPCRRRYELRTTAPRRAPTPNPRAVEEQVGQPTLRTGHRLFDAAYALALEEAREASVSRIQDGAFNDGLPVDCAAPGCFETGKDWRYVWTRDTGYALDLGLAFFDPPRGASSLLFKVSDERGGGSPELVQDTGTGGSWPVSTDRVVLALGARALLPHLEPELRASFTERFFVALRNTVERDRRAVFDPEDGLYRGEQSFLDWREQSYPAWAAEELVHVGLSKALSTNVAHLLALRLLVELADARGEATLASATRLQASELGARIRERFWLADEQLLSSFIPTTLDPAPTRRFDLLGLSLAILADVLSPAEARAALSRYPLLRHGPPVLWPQQQFIPIYHNRAIWPFVTAYGAKAARRADHAAFCDHALRSLFSGAVLFLSNLENLELVSGLPYLEDGLYSGPVVNSERQLWSVGAYLGAVNEVLFGLEASADRLLIRPYLPRALRAALFPSSSELQLTGVPFGGRRVTVRLRLPPLGAETHGAYRVTERRLDGAPLSQDSVPFAQLGEGDEHVFELVLADPTEPPGDAARLVTDTGDYRQLFGPRTPSIAELSPGPSGVTVRWALAGESPAELEVSVYRDGELIASGLPGASAHHLDAGGSTDGRVSCYAVETRFAASGNTSQRSAPACLFAASGAVRSFYASDFQAVGGTLVNQHGRPHFEAWGDPGHELVIPEFSPSHSGSHLIQLIGSNGAGPRSTGITAGAKRLSVYRVSDGATVAEGLVFLPQSGRWDEWREGSFLGASLEAGVAYRLVLDDSPWARNMSQLQHFEAYTGGLGGRNGAFFRLNVAELRVLTVQDR